MLLDAAYVNRQRALQLTARVADGWSKKTKTFGYSESTNLDFKEGYRIRAQLTILPRPSGFYDTVRIFEPSWLSIRDDPNISYRLLQGVLTITVQLLNGDGAYNLGLPWHLTSNKKASVQFMEPSFVSENYINFELQLLVVFNPPPLAKPLDVYEPGEGFFSGGLPTLGKRR